MSELMRISVLCPPPLGIMCVVQHLLLPPHDDACREYDEELKAAFEVEPLYTTATSTSFTLLHRASPRSEYNDSQVTPPPSPEKAASRANMAQGWARGEAVSPGD